MKQSYPVIQKHKPSGKLALIKVDQKHKDPRPKPEPDPEQPKMGGYLLIILFLLAIGVLAVAAFN